MEWEELTSFCFDQQHSGPMNKAPLPKYKWVEPIQDQTRLRSEQSLERVFCAGLDCVSCGRPSQSCPSTRPASACLHELRGHKAEVLAVEHIPEVDAVLDAVCSAGGMRRARIPHGGFANARRSRTHSKLYDGAPRANGSSRAAPTVRYTYGT